MRLLKFKTIGPPFFMLQVKNNLQAFHKILLFVSISPLIFVACNQDDGATLPPTSQYIDEAFGIAIPYGTHGRTEDVDFRKEAGFSWVRRDINWRDNEPIRGQFDFSAIDEVIDREVAMGIQVLGILDYGHPEYSSSQTELAPPDNVEDFGNFVFEAVSRLKDRIHVWEIWNEPNLFVFWNPVPNHLEYGPLAREAIRNIKLADPEAKIMLGGMLGNLESFVGFGNDFLFLDGLVNDFSDIFYEIDYLSLHPYTWLQYAAPETQSGYHNVFQVRFADMIQQMRSKVARSGRGDLPIWIPEYGWHTAENSPLFYGVSEDVHASYMVRAAVIALTAQIEKIFAFTYMDGDGSETDKESHFGLLEYTSPNEPPVGKPAYYALKNLIGHTTQKAFIRDLAPEMNLPPRVFAYLFQDEAGEDLIIAWTRNDHVTQLTFQQVPVSVFDLYGSSLTPGQEIPIGDHPVFIYLN